MEAIRCSSYLHIEVIDLGILSLLEDGSRFIYFNADIPRQTAVTLKDVCAHLGPEVVMLKVSWVSFPDADLVSNLRLSKRQNVPLKEFEMVLPTFDRLLNWLQNNAKSLGGLCIDVIVSTPRETKCPNNWIQLVERAVDSFNQHQTPTSRYVYVYVSGQFLEFSFQTSCHG